MVRRDVCLMASLFEHGSFATMSGNMLAGRVSRFEEAQTQRLLVAGNSLRLGGLSLVGPVEVCLMGIFCSSVSMLFSLLSVHLVSS